MLSSSTRNGIEPCGYVWPDPTDNANTMKTRRQAVRKSLAELVAAGWGVEEYAKAKFDIRRPNV